MFLTNYLAIGLFAFLQATSNGKSPLSINVQGRHSTDTEWGLATPTSSMQNERSNPITSTQEEENVDIAIIGGGLAGLALAIGLIQSLPHNEGKETTIKVYERAPELRSKSQGMMALSPNGMHALHQIHADLPNLILDSGCAFKHIVHVIITAENEVKESRSELPEPGKDGYVSVLIRWHAVQKVLASLLPPHVIASGYSLSSFVEEEGSREEGGEGAGVKLYFENGKVVRCRAAIGADGTFSSVRKCMFAHDDSNDRTIYFGQMNWNIIVPTHTLPKNLHPINGVKSISHQGNPKWSAFINDCGGNHTFWQFRLDDADMASALSGSHGRGGMGIRGIKDALRPILCKSPDLEAVLQAAPEGEIFERSIVGRMPAGTWRSDKGRVSLCGDAAHGMHPGIGQGANSAFQSAAILVEALASCDGDWIRGLEMYEARRKPRADLVHRIANMVGSGAASSILSPPVIKEWIEWCKSVDTDPLPPSDGRVEIEDFDPLSQPHVSFL